MVTQKKQTKRTPIVIVVLALILCLCIAGIVTTAMGQRSALPTLREALVYIGYLLVLSYAFVGYRVPHGNLLKYTILVFALLLVITVAINPSYYGSTAGPDGGAEAPLASDGEALPAPVGAPDAPEKPAARSPHQEKQDNLLELVFLGATLILISYMAGRLNRINENRYIACLALLLLLLRALLADAGDRFLPAGFNEFNMWLVLNCSYILRYKEHREAGVLDKKQAE